MTKYQSDQFFNIDSTRPAQWRRNVSGNDNTRFVNPNSLNDDFLFPDKTIRHIKPSFDGKTWSEDTAILQKGYIRRINEFNDGNEEPLLCRFQFNPQFINQAASFQSSTVNPIYQPIEQLQQPIASMTNFSFRLIFDRSMEINQDSTDVLIRTTDNPWETGGPRQVGVLHDINALFRVIGQGISADDVEGAITRAAETLAASDARLGRDSVTEEDEAIYSEAGSNASRFFQNNVNVGNTAFILPYPVRIVFSSLYIVEGFITQTSLEILKFSSSYVPMMAQVTLSVNAIYLGFAKRNTYFTHVLEQSAVDRRNELERVATRQNNAVETLRAHFNRLHMKLVRGDSSKSPPRDRPAPGTSADQIIKFNQLFDNFTPPANKAYTIGVVYASPTDWIKPRGSSTGSRSPGTSAQTPGGTTSPEEFTIVSSDGQVADDFENGVITNLTITWKASLFGPYTGSFFVSGQPARVGDIPQNVSDILSDPRLASAVVRASPVKTVTVNTKQQWLDLSDPAASADSVVSIPLIRFSASLDNTNFWLLFFEAEINVTINGTKYTSNSSSFTELSRISQRPLALALSFSWDNYFDPKFAPPAASAPAPAPGEVAPPSAAAGDRFELGIIP